MTIRLLRIDTALAEALEGGADAFERAFGARLGEAAPLVREILPASLPLSVGSDPPWGTYLAVDEGSQQVIGACGFKGPPGAEGIVEIAYYTFPAFENRGYATAVAARLVEMAQSSPAVRRVIAHTLPEPNASTRVLTKIGMQFVGEVWDPEDGRVWRWERGATVL